MSPHDFYGSPIYSFGGDREISNAYLNAHMCGTCAFTLYELICRYGRAAGGDSAGTDQYEVAEPSEDTITDILQCLLNLRTPVLRAQVAIRPVLRDLEGLRGLGEMVDSWPGGQEGTAHQALVRMGTTMCMALEQGCGLAEAIRLGQPDGPGWEVDSRRAIALLRPRFPELCVLLLRMGSPLEALTRLLTTARREADRAAAARAARAREDLVTASEASARTNLTLPEISKLCASGVVYGRQPKPEEGFGRARLLVSLRDVQEAARRKRVRDS
jgi:hypothetical protein